MKKPTAAETRLNALATVSGTADDNIRSGGSIELNIKDTTDQPHGMVGLGSG